MHNVGAFPSRGYVVTLHRVNFYVNGLQQCKCIFTFCYIHRIIKEDEVSRTCSTKGGR
jgi:hypothetical protein